MPFVLTKGGWTTPQGHNECDVNMTLFSDVIYKYFCLVQQKTSNKNQKLYIHVRVHVHVWQLKL